MRKVMIEKEIYNLEDLKQNKALYEKAQRKFAEGECEVDWSSSFIDEKNTAMSKMGWYDLSIYFNGFYSQGDGASIAGKIDIEDALSILKREVPAELKEDLCLQDTITIGRMTTMYYHSNTLKVNVEFQEADDIVVENKLNEFIEQLGKDVLDWIKEESDKFYNELQQHYEYLWSNENFEEDVKSNDYEFDIDGDIVNY